MINNSVHIIQQRKRLHRIDFSFFHIFESTGITEKVGVEFFFCFYLLKPFCIVLLVVDFFFSVSTVSVFSSYYYIYNIYHKQ